MSRYELTEGTSRKFWDVSLQGTQLLLRWGRIGTDGRSKVFEFPTAAAARDRQTKLIREKTAKGYRPAKSTPPVRKAGAGTSHPAHRQSCSWGPSTAAIIGQGHRPRVRLRSAFAALNAMGFVAIENAGYTQSDGWDDVNEVATRLADSGKPPRAGVFYHGQDVERGKRGQGLMLTFGSYADQNADADSVAVGHIIIDVLKAHGFRPKWDGTISTRIHTGRFDWR